MKQLSLEKIDRNLERLSIYKQKSIENLLASNSPEDLIKAQEYLKSKKIEKQDFKAFLYSPDNEYYSGNDYKQSTAKINPILLRRMSELPNIAAIIGTRQEQILEFRNFTEDEQKAGWTIKPIKKDAKITDSDKRDIEAIAKFLQYGGIKGKWEVSDDFDDWIKKYINDSLVLDQTCTEFERNRKGELIAFRQAPSETMRILETVDPKELAKYQNHYVEVNGFLPTIAQVWHGQIQKHWQTSEPLLFYPWEMSFTMRNKSSDIRRNGYGKSELEILSDVVTWILWGQQYNGNFFKNGSNPKGFFTIEGYSDQNVLNEFRSSWRATMAGVENSHRVPVFEGGKVNWVDMMHCLHGDSEVITINNGKKTLNQLLNNNNEVYSEIWDGLKFNKARIFKTGEKKICEMTLNNGLNIKTSPDHRFLTLRNNNSVWVERKNIVIGDYVFINKKEVVSVNEKLYFKEKEVENDLFEILGWITGDGNIGNNENSQKYIRTYYHPYKEQDILNNHLLIFEKYGINAKKYLKKRSEKSQTKLKKEYGIKTIISEYYYVCITDVDFYKWMLDLGFTTSKDGKTIPDFIYSYNSDRKCSFLKGFFSADGHISKNGGQINITISNPILKNQTKMLLMSEGIRCTSYKSKKVKSRFGTFSENNVLIIKDRELFLNKINFIQEYKQNRKLIRQKSHYNNNEAPIEFIKELALSIKNYNKELPINQRLPKKYLHDLLNISKGYQKASLSKILFYANEINFKIPSFLNDYNLEMVIELSEQDETIGMIDVEMFNETHQFCANGIIVHNSNRDMEYQNWQEFLIILLCSVYKIDPSELGYHFRNQADVFGQQGQQERLAHSRSKGFKPLLRMIEKDVNKYLVSELNDKYIFSFCGIDIEDEQKKIENDTRLSSAGFVSMEDMFQKYSGRKFNPDKDTILNNVYLQSLQMKQYGGQESNQAVDEMTGEPDKGAKNPFKEQDQETEKSEVGDPITSEVLRYMEKTFKN